MRALFVGLGMSVGLLSACIGELEEEGPCSSQGLCLVGFECVEGWCLKCESGGCGGLAREPIGPEGGKVCSTDQACVTVPAGALSAEVQLYIRRSPIAVSAAVDARSIAYEAGPLDLPLLKPVSLRVPISPSDPVSNIRVFRSSSPGAVWAPLDSTPQAAYVDTTTTQLGYFVAGRPR